MGQTVVHDSNLDLFGHCATVFNCEAVRQDLSDS